MTRFECRCRVPINGTSKSKWKNKSSCLLFYPLKKSRDCTFPPPASMEVSSSHNWENTLILLSMYRDWPHPFIKSDKSFAFTSDATFPPSFPPTYLESLRLLHLNQECKWGWSLTKPGVTYITANDGPRFRKKSWNERESEWSWPTYKGTTSRRNMFLSH